MDEVLHSLRGSRYFCKLELHKAYLHLKVDEEGSKIQKISTHKGMFKINHLSFGIKTVASEFNRVLTQLMGGLSKVEAYFDDIICHGASLGKCMKNLMAGAECLKKNNLHINRAKCAFFKESINYLGGFIQQDSKVPTKVDAVFQVSQPRNVDELTLFLGLVTYYAKFVPDFSSKTHPLKRLLKKGENFFWSVADEASFLNLKSEL